MLCFLVCFLVFKLLINFKILSQNDCPCINYIVYVYVAVRSTNDESGRT